ncbi:uncharacterized protein EAF01_006908 [Botrytis porri]|uniref:Uncharacterized protein n=1 Tax=Botrytis porri TaxID=87229 RepID=A0A4Z1KHI5_9HELO|nr:uncharacterized protein EAF01_006908 [Botrytis porri]KAF7901609.1 hypothetical protein EAF01_006908 [Botrytis porri]TGO85551.1 hypothetical protein BPOR_0385g00020 [Botrytis porri]
MDQNTQNAPTDSVDMAEKKSTAQTNAVINGQKEVNCSPLWNYPPKKSTSPALLPLPAEMIRMIAELLPDSYAACLTLSSRVYLAAKRHRSGIDLGFPLEAFRHQEVTHHQSTNTTTLPSVDARFVSNELRLRSQTWDFLPRSQNDATIEDIAYGGISDRVCNHSKRRSLEFVVSNFVGSNSSLARTVQCHYCWMDFGMRRKHCGVSGTAIIITRWINLGAGLDPNDLSIREAFEDQEGLSEEEFTSGNYEKLLSEMEKKASN